MAQTLRIVHTVSSLKGGGMEHFVLRLVEAQRRHGHESSIVALHGGPLEELARQRGLPTTVLEISRSTWVGTPRSRVPTGPGPLGSARAKARRVTRAAMAFRLAQPDIVHAHNPTSLHYATVGKLLTRARLVFTDHAQTRGIIRVPTRFEWRQTDAVVGCSQDTADKSGAVGIAANISVIHNGIDIVPPRRTREEMRRELGLGDEVVGIMPAAFHPVKGHDVLLRALGRLREEEIDMTATADPRGPGGGLRVLIAGDGDERDRIHGLARELGLSSDRVTFLGFRKDVPDLLMAADLFVLPSRNEGLPLAVLEAMARSLPVVVCPVGGVPEVVTDGENGLLVPVDDDRALADALGTLARDEELRRRLGDAGYRRVRDDFSFEQMTRKYEDLYFRVVGSPASV